jgi:nucleoside-diphosphate-sugar epimerase
MLNSSTQTILILGARGRLGSALALAFRSRGWNVLQQVRRRNPGDGVDMIDADARDADAVLRAVLRFHGGGVDVVVNACNPLYTRWAKEALPLNEASIEIARALKATLMFPGNVYNFGADMTDALKRETEQHATTRKGKIRVAMEKQLALAAESGLQSIVIRAGDYFGCSTGSWFDLVIAKDLHRGKVVAPGRLDAMHSWAYVPDLAETFVNAADARERLSTFERIHFAGHVANLQTIIESIESITARRYKIGTLPWPIIRGLSFAVPMWREIAELAYLWQRSHQLITAPEHQPLIAPQTPINEALRRSIAAIHPSLLGTDAPRLAGTPAANG